MVASLRNTHLVVNCPGLIFAKFGSNPFTAYREDVIQLLFSYKYLEPFGYHSNPTSRLINTRLAILKSSKNFYQIMVKLLLWLWRSCHFKVLIDAQMNRL